MCASVAAGVGVGGCASYKGDGVIESNLERSVGLYGGAAIMKDKKYVWGERQDGKYYEGCGATGKKQYCSGINDDQTTYGYTQKAIAGKVAGVKLSEGKQTTTDLKLPPIPRPAEAPSKMGYHTLDLVNHGLF